MSRTIKEEKFLFLSRYRIISLNVYTHQIKEDECGCISTTTIHLTVVNESASFRSLDFWFDRGPISFDLQLDAAGGGTLNKD